MRQHDKSDSSMYLIKSGAALVYTETKGGGINHGPKGLAGKGHGGHSSRKWSMREQQVYSRILLYYSCRLILEQVFCYICVLILE